MTIEFSGTTFESWEEAAKYWYNSREKEVEDNKQLHNKINKYKESIYELKKILQDKWSPKCGWDEYVTCDEHASCEEAHIIMLSAALSDVCTNPFACELHDACKDYCLGYSSILDSMCKHVGKHQKMYLGEL